MNEWAKVGIVLFITLNWVGFMLLLHFSTEEYPVEKYSCAELQEGKELLAKESFLGEKYYSNYSISQEIIKRCILKNNEESRYNFTITERLGNGRR